MVALLRLSHTRKGRERVVKRLCKSKNSRLLILKSLFVMADMSPATSDRPLKKSNTIATLLNMVLAIDKIQKTLVTLIADTANLHGPVALRYILKHNPSVLDSGNADLVQFATRILTASIARRDASSVPPLRQTVRLFEYLLRSGRIQPNELPDTTYVHLKAAPRDTDTRIATMHLVRAMKGAQPDAMRQLVKETIQEVAHAVCHDTNWDGRRVALSVLVVMLPIENPWFKSEDCVFMTTVVDVLLWKLDWQHGAKKIHYGE